MRLLILGAATSGLAAARLARRLGYAVSIYDEDRSLAGPLLAEGFGALTGGWDPGVLDGVDLVVTSPGIPERSSPITDAFEAGIPVWSELELAWRSLDAPVVAITGTNGKTTVTTLVSRMLTESGMRAPALGNIGTALSDAVDEAIDVAVVEVSSFQLRFVDRFHPGIAVVTNVAPDHLDWHGSFHSYLAAKRRIVENQGPDDVLVYDAEDEGARAVAGHAPGRVLPVSTRGEGAATLREGMLVWPRVSVPRAELEVTDRAFLVDLLLAGTAALEAGADPEAVARVARSFRPGPHRRAVVGEAAGVLYVDDSKATNPHAALAAIRAYPSVVLVAGGLPKGLDVTPLARQPNVRHLVAIGTAAPELLEAAGERGEAAGSMEEAVEAARRAARPGDVVLLAPGCASFDMFPSYQARGDAFAAAVATIMGGESP